MAAKKHVLLAGVLIAVTLSGCTKSAGRSPESLSKGLLDITDMPGEWQETQRDVYTTRAVENPSIDPSTWCPGAKEEVTKLDDLAGDAGADVEMQMQVDGAEVPRMMRLQAWRSESASDYFAEIVTVLNICDDAKWAEDTGVAQGVLIQEIWKIDGPEVGDESVSWGSQVVPPKGKEMATSSGRTTVARLGEVIMVLQIGDFTTSSGAGQLGDADWREIVQRAADKLADV